MASCEHQREAERTVRMRSKAKPALLGKLASPAPQEPSMAQRKKREPIGRIWWKPIPYCSAAERLVLAHRFALYLDRSFAGLQSLLDLIESAGEEGPTTAELTALLELIEADRGSIKDPNVDEPSMQELKAIFQPVNEKGEGEVCMEAQTHMHTPTQALDRLRKFEARNVVVVDAKRHWVYLWAVQGNGELFPVPIVRLSRSLLQEILSAASALPAVCRP